MALQLLVAADGAPTELGEQVAARYREILVDEYQDTNEVQNAIFRAVSKNSQNIFTVGDVKQSIYRFRLADPTIFLEKYNRYRSYEEAQEGEPRRILLSKNFRSRQEILDAANFVFENILSGIWENWITERTRHCTSARSIIRSAGTVTRSFI